MKKGTEAFKACYVLALEDPNSSFVQRMFDRSEIRTLNRSIARKEKVMNEIQARLDQLSVSERNNSGKSILGVTLLMRLY